MNLAIEIKKSLEEELVSVIMPAYNCEKYIEETLNSVINQSYLNWEIIVVDDCSSDNTIDILKKYSNKDPRIKHYRLDKNFGAAVTRNKAIDMAEGKYIAFLDSDDVWFPEKLKKQISLMKQKNYSFTCTSYNKIDSNGKDLCRIIKAKAKSDYEGVLKACPGNSTVIYDANILGKHKIPNIKKRNDYVMWLQVIKKAKYLYGIEEVLSSHRLRPDGISSKKSKLVAYHWKVYREIENLTIFKSCYLILYWVFITLFKLR